MSYISSKMEHAIVELVNNTIAKKVYLESYQKVELGVQNETALKDILKKFKFVDVGNTYKFKDELPKSDTVHAYDLSSNFKLFERIAISKKLNSAMVYSASHRFIFCTFLIDIKHLKKFSINIKDIIQNSNDPDIFRGIDFKCKDGDYIEVSDPEPNDEMEVKVSRKKVENEKLVFDKNSTIAEVMSDISMFFKDETRAMYEKMQIAHKRGIILYGDPGNGKSAMIREIIRTLPKITKVIINPDIDDITKVLSLLLKSLNKRPAVIIIEDIDSSINGSNRSEFLNILDGIDMQSGVFFIGTTNYPARIDPAFMNRSGRFDRTYKIGNPSDKVRHLFFSSRDMRDLLKEFPVYQNRHKKVTDDSIIDLFVKYSKNIPMATLKEIMTSTQYMLVSNEGMSIEEALFRTYKKIVDTRTEHGASHNQYKKKKRNSLYSKRNRKLDPFMDDDDYFDEEVESAESPSTTKSSKNDGEYIRNEEGFILVQSNPVL